MITGSGSREQLVDDRRDERLRDPRVGGADAIAP
jgi:hypothetical protein